MEGSVLKKIREVRSKDNAENLMFLFPSESPPDHRISSWTALSFMDFCFCFSNDSDIPIRKKLPRKSTFHQRPNHRLGTHNWATLPCLVSICLQLCFYHVIPNNWRCWLLTPVSVFVGSTLDLTENPPKGMQRSLFCVQVKLSQLLSPNPLSSGLYFLFLEKPSVECSYVTL